jgi:hypothetical protein
MRVKNTNFFNSTKYFVFPAYLSILLFSHKDLFNLIILKMADNVHIVPEGEKWAVKSDNAKKAYRITDTQKEAIEIGKSVAQNRESELLIHGKNGKIRQKDSYGNDDYPPKG